MDRYSLYKLPLIGALTYFLVSFLTVGMPLIRLYASPDFDMGYMMDLLWMSGNLYLMKACILLPALMLVLHHFKLNICTLKNALAVIAIVAVIMGVNIVITRSVGELLLAVSTDYSVSVRILQIFASVIHLFGFLGMLILALMFFSRDLDHYEGTPLIGQKYWLFANLFAIFGVFATLLSGLYSIVLFFVPEYWVIDGAGGIGWLYIPISLGLLLMLLSKKITLTTIELKPVLIAGIMLAILTLLLIIIGIALVMWADTQSIGGFIVALLSLLIGVSLILLISPIILVKQCFKEYVVTGFKPGW